MADNLNAFLSSCAILDKISDMTRLVDPVQKSVIEYSNNVAVNGKIHCFEVWGKNKICDNCISMRAYNDEKTYVKIEYINDKTYMITAVPYDLADRRVVIEILKDITNSMLFDSGVGDDGSALTGIHSLIDSMNKLAFSDALTGLYNRRYINEKLPVDLLNAALLSTEISVIMADLDLFKIVNDNYGHLAGDLTLKNAAEILTGCVKRGSDWVARYGGEEFLICMPGAELDVAIKASEFMRKSIETSVIRYQDKEFSVTASFGIYNTKSAGNESVDELLKHADEKLYLAKKNGRNRIEY